MVSKAAIYSAKAALGVQLCRFGGYRTHCPAGDRCLNHHYDDEKGAQRSNTNMCNLASPDKKKEYKQKLRTRYQSTNKDHQVDDDDDTIECSENTVTQETFIQSRKEGNARTDLRIRDL